VLAAAEPLAPGYTVVAHLRRGRRLDVYDVWSEKRECRCVAKVLRPDRGRDRRARARLRREGELLREITHPHIVRAYEVLRQPQPTVILETLGGETLGHLVERRRRLACRELVFLGLHVASAVRYLHGLGILHLDLKPGNVVCREDGRAIVLDLSIARGPGRIRHPCGTPRYMAPEQARPGRVSTATDVFGVGTVLFAAAAGDPFGHVPPEERAIRSVSELRRLPNGLGELIDSCLALEPDRRPTIASLLSTLAAQAGEGAPGSDQSSIQRPEAGT
jgi:serine/threonine protein kinase